MKVCEREREGERERERERGREGERENRENREIEKHCRGGGKGVSLTYYTVNNRNRSKPSVPVLPYHVLENFVGAGSKVRCPPCTRTF